MKNLFSLLLSLGLILLIFACDPDKDKTPGPGETPGKPSTTGAVTPVGTPEGTAITATIGPAGGTIQSADQRIKVSIPAGALSTDQVISVQPLSNHCPSGTGQAFRLTPHGITFAKPAAITFQYSDTDVNGSAPEFLRVAYQNAKGMWQSPSLKSIDTTAHTVTVLTTHFSDWSLFKNVFLNPQNAIIDPGAQVDLSVRICVEPDPDQAEDLLVPLPELLDEKYIDSWVLAGEGSLKYTKNSDRNTYQSPNHIPARNPVAITVFLNKTEKIDGRVYRDLRVVSNVFIAPEGISVQIDGGDWITYPGGANINSTQNVILGKSGAESASVTWKGAPSGKFHWTKSTNVAFNLLRGPMIYQHIYGIDATVSGGSLQVDNSDGTWVTGSFILQPAGWIRPSTPPDVMGTANIKGVFRVKRVGSN